MMYQSEKGLSKKRAAPSSKRVDFNIMGDMNNGKVTFKQYNMDQPSLLPARLEELIPEDHLVRVVNRMVDSIDIKPLLVKYKGGGTSSYHPRMMLKVLVYAYAEKIFSSRRIAKGLRENVNFMWISGGNKPDFRTINLFRGETMKEAVREVFASVLELLIEGGYVKLENYFVDGTKMEANANPHKVVWAKKTEKYKDRLRQQILDLLDEIEQVNEAEEEAYGEEDLEELGGKGGIDAETLQRKVDELNQRLKEQPEDKKLKKVVKTLEKKHLPRLEKYETQEKVLAGRNSYSKTDPDATCFRMKEDRAAEKPLPRPAYNVQIGTEGQFIVGFSIHQRAGDPGCFIPHMEQQKLPDGIKIQNASTDAAYGSEENYAYLERKQIGNYLKYNTFYRETHPPRKPELIQKASFRVENLPYDADKDEFTCPANHPLTYRETRPYRTENDYLTERRFYECSECATCPLKPQCTKAKGNRRIQISFKLREYRQQAKANLLSEQGIALRKQRGPDVEGAFGDIKHNMGVRRFMLRGLKKVETEWGILSIAHNVRKLAAL
jgi:transposase